MSGDGTGARVYRRKLFFIGGFDLRGPKALYTLWVTEAPRQVEVSGGSLHVGPLSARDDLASRFTVVSGSEGASAVTEVVLLRWDDLIRKHWLKGPWRVMAAVPVFTLGFWRCGLLRLARRGARPLFLTLMLPPVALGLILIMVAALTGLGFLAGTVTGLAGLGLGLMLVLPLWRRLDRTIGLGWLIQCLHHVWSGARRGQPAYQARSARFAEQVLSALDDPRVDEVVLAGFSLGANEAIRTGARLLEARPELARSSPRLSLMLVGQTCSILKQTGSDPEFDQALAEVAASAIPLVNVTSASDPASACTLSPLTGLDGVSSDRVIAHAPRFHKLLTPEHFRAIRRDPLAFHFQYLKATDLKGTYDWFDLTCGAGPLGERVA